MIFKKQLLCILVLILTGCNFCKKPKGDLSYYVLPYQEDVIALQNLNTRVLVYCYTSPLITSQQCATEFENRGYVRLQEIPRLPAEYDFLKDGTYPTRRWRNGEQVPRW